MEMTTARFFYYGSWVGVLLAGASFVQKPRLSTGVATVGFFCLQQASNRCIVEAALLAEKEKDQ